MCMIIIEWIIYILNFNNSAIKRVMFSTCNESTFKGYWIDVSEITVFMQQLCAFGATLYYFIDFFVLNSIVRAVLSWIS